MKTRKLKNWVVYTLVTINFILFILAVGDYKNLLLQGVMAIITIIYTILDYKIITKYGKVENII